MKNSTSRNFRSLSFLILLFLISTTAFSQVGINTITPVEMLDVNGNIKLDGALMPNNLPGTANELLLSGGANAPAVWGPEMLNVSQTTSIGKFFVNGVSIGAGTNLILTVTDTNTVISSTCSVTWHQITPGPGPPLTDFSGLHIISKAEAGNWVFYIENHTGRALTTGFSFVAFY